MLIYLPLATFLPAPIRPQGNIWLYVRYYMGYKASQFANWNFNPRNFFFESKWLSRLISNTPLKSEDVDTCWRESLSTWSSALRILMLPSIWRIQPDSGPVLLDGLQMKKFLSHSFARDRRSRPNLFRHVIMRETHTCILTGTLSSNIPV